MAARVVQGSMRDELSLKHHDSERNARKALLDSLEDEGDESGLAFGPKRSNGGSKPKGGRKVGAKSLAKPKASTIPKNKHPSRTPHHEGNSPPHSPRGNSSVSPTAFAPQRSHNSSLSPNAFACSACKGLSHQVHSLSHALMELGSSSLKWMAQRKALDADERQHFSELVLNLIQPCASLDPSLDTLCMEIKHNLGASNDATELLMKQVNYSQQKPPSPHSLKDAQLTNAALKIQGKFRGNQARRTVAAMRDENAAVKIQAHFRRMQSRREVDAMRAERDNELSKAAKAVKKGAVYISKPPGKDQKHQSAEVHKSFDSWAVVNMIPAGSTVVVAGPARQCGNVVMMPIEYNGEFVGVVNLSLFEEVQDNRSTTNGAGKKQGFFTRLLPQRSKKSKGAE